MRGASKTLVAALVVLLLAASLAACGSGDDSSSTAADTSGQEQPAGKGDASSGGGEGKASSGGSTGNKKQSGGSSSGTNASDFTPKQHTDSGGGSQKYRVKGGDNSIQEFGNEADTSEFAAAAVALHNFLDARAEGNWAAACGYMSKRVIASFNASVQTQGKRPSCAEILEALINPAAKDLMTAEAAQADVRSLRIEGERAFALYTDPDGAVLAMPMENEDGTWKVSSIAGTPLS